MGYDTCWRSLGGTSLTEEGHLERREETGLRTELIILTSIIKSRIPPRGWTMFPFAQLKSPCPYGTGTKISQVLLLA